MPKDTQPPDRHTQFYEIWECSQPVCGLRFPILEEEIGRISWSGACPRCHAPLHVIGRYPCGGGESIPFPVQPSLENAACIRPSVRALLDNIRSTWNVGSMLRTADGSGLEHVYLCGITPGGNHPKTALAALGAERSVPWSQHANALRLSLELKNAGWALWALESASPDIGPQIVSIFDKRLGEVPPPEKVLLIVGNERLGVDAHILPECDRILTIPMLGEKGSLNVAVAFGIAAYRLRLA